jgi:hypothetical protein
MQERASRVEEALQEHVGDGDAHGLARRGGSDSEGSDDDDDESRWVGV